MPLLIYVNAAAGYRSRRRARMFRRNVFVLRHPDHKWIREALRILVRLNRVVVIFFFSSALERAPFVVTHVCHLLSGHNGIHRRERVEIDYLATRVRLSALKRVHNVLPRGHSNERGKK